MSSGGPRLPDALANRVADAMFALATPSRVQVLHVLVSGPRTVGELTELLGMEQSAVSHQLRVLREHDLIRVERAGRSRVYSFRDDQVAAFLEAALDHVQRVGGTGARRAEPGSA